MTSCANGAKAKSKPCIERVYINIIRAHIETYENKYLLLVDRYLVMIHSVLRSLRLIIYNVISKQSR